MRMSSQKTQTTIEKGRERQSADHIGQNGEMRRTEGGALDSTPSMANSDNNSMSRTLLNSPWLVVLFISSVREKNL